MRTGEDHHHHHRHHHGHDDAVPLRHEPEHEHENKTLKFDNIDLQGSATGAIPTKYAGFTWANVGVSDTTDPRYDGSGFEHGVTSGTQVAYAEDGAVASFHAAANTTFSLESMDLTAAWDSKLKVEIDGYSDGHLRASMIVTLDDLAAKHVDFKNFERIDEVTFTALKGTHDPNLEGSGNQIVFDTVKLGDIKTHAAAADLSHAFVQHGHVDAHLPMASHPELLQLLHPVA